MKRVKGPVEFRALGTIELRRGGVEIAEVLTQPKRFSLLAYLALAPRRLYRRDTLLALLWPDLDEGHARHALRQALYYLRTRLEDDPFVVRGDDIGVDPERLWCDVTELDQAWRRDDMETVVELYRGELLEGFHVADADHEFDFWLERERYRLRERAFDAGRRLVERARSGGDLEAAIRWATAWRAIQPADQVSLLELIGLLDQAGRRAAALEAYENFVSHGHPVSDDLERLGRRLREAEERGRRRRTVDPPLPPGPLVGRRRLIDEARRLLDGGSRILTLTGPGGVGKTRLAIELAREAEPGFEGGVAWASLGALRDPARVLDVVAEVVGLEPRPTGLDEDRLVSWLADRELLLVLDNLEHLLAAAPFVARLARRCPGLAVLVTSRAPMRVRGEQELGVPPLSLPDPDRRVGGDLPFDSEAVALFVDRVRAVTPSFRLSEANAGSVIEICRRLDGLPLAIELAAPRLKLMSPATLVSRLGTALPLLTGGARDLPERQRALHDTIRWSVDLLTAPERELLFGLSTFSGGCVLDAVEAVWAEASESNAEPMDLLAGLIDASLLLRAGPEEGEVRFTMLESIREYGRAELERSGPATAWHGAHARYYADWVEAGGRGNYCAPGESGWLDRVAEEQENLIAGMEWSLATGEVESAARIAASIAHFWCVRGRLAEGRTWLDRLLAPDLRIQDELRVRCLAAAAALRTYQGLWSEAIEVHEEVVEYRRRVGDPKDLATALHNLGETQREAGRPDEARKSLAESLRIASETGDDLRASFALAGLGALARLQGDLAAARGSLEEALDRARKLDHRGHTAIVLRELAAVARDEGEGRAARRLLEQAAALFEGEDRAGDLAATLERLGEIREGDDPEVARGLYARALRMYRKGGYSWGVARVLRRFARLALEDGRPDRCVELMAGVEALSPAEADRGREPLDRARRALGPATSAACREAGRAMTVDQLARHVDDLIPSVEIPIASAEPASRG
ncbi:MAG TPA: tetratricopeptide repeat protein [Gemmatimonadota bacterium]|nr:tetratricopeptide repeat protein [Gemmatimonadota bacterium]